MTKYNVAVVGAGAVGVEMVRILVQRKFPVKQLKWLARSTRPATVDGRQYQIEATKPESFEGIDIALFAGTEGEKGAAAQFAPEALKRGAVIIDNGSDFRMDPKVPLVIPEINGDAAKNHQGILANPNCTAAVMLMAVGPIHNALKIRRLIISTYQAVSGAGSKAVDELKTQTQDFLAGKKPDKGSFPAPICFNVLANNWKIEELGYSNEEWKLMKETRKILGDESIEMVVTTVRVPVFNAHSESVYFELAKPSTVEAIADVLRKAPGLRYMEDGVPMPIEASGQDDVLAGRIRPDLHRKNGFCLWVSGDNLRRGAALNAVRIAELLVEKGWLKNKKGS